MGCCDRCQTGLQIVRQLLSIDRLEQCTPKLHVPDDGRGRVNELGVEDHDLGEVAGLDAARFPLISNYQCLVERKTAP